MSGSSESAATSASKPPTIARACAPLPRYDSLNVDARAGLAPASRFLNAGQDRLAVRLARRGVRAEREAACTGAFQCRLGGARLGVAFGLALRARTAAAAGCECAHRDQRESGLEAGEQRREAKTRESGQG